jgi:L-Ala-D/L-Glu epimerase
MSGATFLELRLSELRIPFKLSFRHAAAERTETSSLVVAARTAHHTGYGESCPRPYVTGETIDTAREFFARHEAGLRREVIDVDTLEHWAAVHHDEIDRHPAAWCALELALLDGLARERDIAVEALLELPPLRSTFRYSAVVGDGPLEVFKETAERYRAYGLVDFKIKLAGDFARDRQKVEVLRGWSAQPVRVRADANNLWRTADEAIRFLRSLEYPFHTIEEPIDANQYEELARVSAKLKCGIILDESFLRIEQLAILPRVHDTPWIVNVRISKMGGLLRSIRVVRAAASAGIGVIVGAQVGETSLLTRAALIVAQAAGDDLVAQEGAFGTFLLERDPATPSLMFGEGGRLDPNAAGLGPSGFGLAFAPS